MSRNINAATQMEYDLYEILQCPVCLEIPTSSVATCAQGHHLCNKCKAKIRQCPICERRYTAARNYVVQDLALKYDKLIEFLNYLSTTISALIPSTPRSPSPSPERPPQRPPEPSPALNVSIQVLNPLVTPRQLVSSNICQCIIGCCQIQTPTNSMYNHIREVHPTQLIQANATGCNNFSFQLEYSLNKMHDYMINIIKLGTFFFNIYIDEKGRVMINLQMVRSYNRNTLFKYKIRIINDDTGKAIMHNTRIKRHQINAKYNPDFYISSEEFQNYFLNFTELSQFYHSITCELDINIDN